MEFSENVISEDSSIRTVLAALDKAAAKILFVLDHAGKVVGSVTDGDVRRGVLKGLTVDESVSHVMNLKPIIKEKGKPFNFSRLRELGASIVPLVDGDGVFLKIERIPLEAQPIPNRAVIMAGGLGTRLGDLTKDVPKPMLMIGQKPILQIIMERLSYFGVTNFYLSVNYKREMIKNFFGDGSRFGWSVHYVEEPIRMGTAGSLRLFDDHEDLPFLVLNGDVISDINLTSLLNQHDELKTDFTICVKDFSVTVPFGVVKSKNGLITHLEEKPKISFDISAGFYLVNPDCLKYLPPDDYVDMPSFIKSLIESRKTIRSFSIDEYWIDVGRGDDLIKAKNEVRD